MILWCQRNQDVKSSPAMHNDDADADDDDEDDDDDEFSKYLVLR